MTGAEHLSNSKPGAWKVLCPPTHLDEGLEASFSGLLLLLADILSPSITPNLLGRQGGKQGENEVQLKQEKVVPCTQAYSLRGSMKYPPGKKTQKGVLE